MTAQKVPIAFAQFIEVCSSVKPCDMGENLLSVSDSISGLVERSSAALSSVPQSRCRPLGPVSRPARIETRLVPRLSTYV